MNAIVRVQGFWLNHTHSFFVIVRFLFASANGLTAAIGTIYLLGKGLSYTEIGTVWSVSLFFSTVLDFPTGNCADLYGRKLTYALGVISIGAGMVVYGMGTALWMFLVAAFLIGFGTAQISGSLSSWIVDEQVKAHKKGTISKIFGDGSASASAGGIMGGVLVGLFFRGSLEIVYFASGTLFFLTGIFTFTSIPENYGQPGGRWIQLPKNVLTHFIHSLPLVLLSLTLVLMFACYTVFFFIWQPLALQLQIQEGDLGFLYAIFMAGSAVSAFIMGRMSRKIGDVTILMMCFACAATGFLTIALNAGMIGLTAGLIQYAVGYGGFIPVLYAWMNTFIPSSIRASTSSLIGTIGTGGIIVLQVIMGAFIESYGLSAASLCATGFAAAGICALLFLPKTS
ncbi:MAG: MFS transporter [Theionarchaea archaeon]|nr:MFS transporter [Theionarchaea archaeon]